MNVTEILAEARTERMAKLEEGQPARSCVYYLRFCCRIKIGTTTWLERRLSEVQHDELLAVEPGGPELEKLRHEQFADARLIGDWFMSAPALIAHIRALKMGRTSDLKARLISTADAVLYTGRERQILYRWADEGRITRHGVAGKAKWDVLELPAREPGKPAPPPPPLPSEVLGSVIFRSDSY